MLNQYPWWKYVIVVTVFAIGVLYALPNLFGEDPAVQISPASATVKVSKALYSRVTNKLDGDKIKYKSASLDTKTNQMLIRFDGTEGQLKAADELRSFLGRDFTVALNLAPSTPLVLRDLGLNPMYLGLDLRGGVHFLMQVDTKAVIKQAQQSYIDGLRSMLRQNQIHYSDIEPTTGGGIRVSFRNAADVARARPLIHQQDPELNISAADTGDALQLAMTQKQLQEKEKFALQQNITTLRNRVNELGVAEPIIQQQGNDRIVVELPGIQDTTRAKEILGATATLEFHLVDQEHNPEAAVKSGHVPLNSELDHDTKGRPILLHKRVLLTGDYITDASSGLDQQSGQPAVFITLDSAGARRFEDATKDNVGKLLAVVFIETKTETKKVNGKDVRQNYTTRKVINVATIRERLGKRFQITGLESPEQARNLALLLRAGSLAAPITIVEERTVGPSAGQENIAQGFQAGVLAFILIVVFMGVYYNRFGLIANIALVANLILIMAVLSMLQATLTLPGIAGIVLTLGMAVDANVLIFERIREEVRIGNSPQAAIHAGFDKAFGTIMDSNITTLIAAVVLFGFGTGAVKGFAVTLSIGIVTSMFTAIMLSRSVINLIYGGRKLQHVPI